MSFFKIPQDLLDKSDKLRKDCRKSEIETLTNNIDKLLNELNDISSFTALVSGANSIETLAQEISSNIVTLEIIGTNEYNRCKLLAEFFRDMVQMFGNTEYVNTMFAYNVFTLNVPVLGKQSANLKHVIQTYLNHIENNIKLYEIQNRIYQPKQSNNIEQDSAVDVESNEPMELKRAVSIREKAQKRLTEFFNKLSEIFTTFENTPIQEAIVNLDQHEEHIDHQSSNPVIEPCVVIIENTPTPEAIVNLDHHVEPQPSIPVINPKEDPDFKKFYESLDNIKPKIIELVKRKTVESMRAAMAARALYNALNASVTAYANTKDKNDEAKKICREACEGAITTARNELEQFRDGKLILANVVLGLATLGIGYVIAGCIKLAVTGGRHFVLFKPDSTNYVDSIDYDLHETSVFTN